VILHGVLADYSQLLDEPAIEVTTVEAIPR